MIRHNQLRDVFAEACCWAYFPVRIEMGSGLTPDHNHSRPADFTFLASAAASSGVARLILPANMQPPQLSYVDEALAAWSQGCHIIIIIIIILFFIIIYYNNWINIYSTYKINECTLLLLIVRDKTSYYYYYYA